MLGSLDLEFVPETGGCYSIFIELDFSRDDDDDDDDDDDSLFGC